MTGATHAFLLGALCIAYLACAAFFLRYWKRTRDRLFLIFALAFASLAAAQPAFLQVLGTERDHVELYLLRLAAYSAILVAIIDKNRR